MPLARHATRYDVTAVILATAYCGYKYYELRDVPESSGAPEFTTNLDYYLNLTYTWLSLGQCFFLNIKLKIELSCKCGVVSRTGIIAAVILLIILILAIFLRKRILIAVELIKEASRYEHKCSLAVSPTVLVYNYAPYRAIGYMLGSLLWPLIPWILNVILFGYWGASAIFLASMGDPEGASINETYVEQDQVEMFVDDATLNVPCEPGVRYRKATQNILFWFTSELLLP